MVKLTTKVEADDGSVQHIADTWVAVRSDREYSHLSFSTDNGLTVIPFNREICCALSPFLSKLVKGAFCCCSNSETTIILPQEVSSKTVYDLQSLMFGGTVCGLNAHAVKELKSLFNILGFQYTLIREEGDDNDGITVGRVFKMEDDREEGEEDVRDEGEATGDGEHGEDDANGSKDKEKPKKDAKVIRVEVVTDDTGEIGDVRANVANVTEDNLEELRDEDRGSIEKEGNPEQDYTDEPVNLISASNKENSKENNNDMSGTRTEKTGGNGEGRMTSCSEKGGDVEGNYKKLNMNCEVKVEKLKKNVNGNEGNGNDSDGPVKKRQKRSVTKNVSYHNMESDTWHDSGN